MKTRDMTKLIDQLKAEVDDWERQAKYLDEQIRAAKYLIRVWGNEVEERPREEEVPKAPRVNPTEAAVEEREEVLAVEVPRTNGAKESNHEAVVRVALELIQEKGRSVGCDEIWERVESLGAKYTYMQVILSNESRRGKRLVRVSIGRYDRIGGAVGELQAPETEVGMDVEPEQEANGRGMEEKDGRLYAKVLQVVREMRDYPVQAMMESLKGTYPDVEQSTLALYIADAQFEAKTGRRV